MATSKEASPAHKSSIEGLTNPRNDRIHYFIWQSDCSTFLSRWFYPYFSILWAAISPGKFCGANYHLLGGLCCQKKSETNYYFKTRKFCPSFTLWSQKPTYSWLLNPNSKLSFYIVHYPFHIDFELKYKQWLSPYLLKRPVKQWKPSRPIWVQSMSCRRAWVVWKPCARTAPIWFVRWCWKFIKMINYSVMTGRSVQLDAD